MFQIGQENNKYSHCYEVSGGFLGYFAWPNDICYIYIQKLKFFKKVLSKLGLTSQLDPANPVSWKKESKKLSWLLFPKYISKKMVPMNIWHITMFPLPLWINIFGVEHNGRDSKFKLVIIWKQKYFFKGLQSKLTWGSLSDQES